VHVKKAYFIEYVTHMRKACQCLVFNKFQITFTHIVFYKRNIISLLKYNMCECNLKFTKDEKQKFLSCHCYNYFNFASWKDKSTASRCWKANFECNGSFGWEQLLL